MRTVLFKAITQRVVVIPYRRFGTTWEPNGSIFKARILTPEERRSHPPTRWPENKSGITSLKNKPSLQLFVLSFLVTSNLTNRRNSTKTGTERSLRFPVRKSNDALQACCFEVTWVAGGCRECDFNKKQATYPGGRIDPSTTPPKLEDR